jgi:hypothetical protein
MLVILFELVDRKAAQGKEYNLVRGNTKIEPGAA